jgi:hypothetical protein
MATYKVEISAHYTAVLTVEADSEVDAAEQILDDLPSDIWTESGTLDYWGSEATAEEV